ncbi:MAG: hypothetical protein LRS47_02185 [Desulfurococcales archaeon]|nr:hypothetical protein [Desulfurococcales archaeon]
MGTDTLVAILYNRLDLLEYAEKLVERLELNEDDSVLKDLIHITNRLRVLRRKMSEESSKSDEGDDRDTLLEYYRFISVPREVELLTKIKLLLEERKLYPDEVMLLEDDIRTLTSIGKE